MNRQTLAFVPVLALAVGILVSCASGPHVQKEGDVLRLIDLINQGGVAKVEGLATVPFVLDSETLYLQSDVDTMWKNLAAAGFRMTQVRFVASVPVGPESYTVFNDSFDLKNYFAKYTGRDTSVVTVDTAEGRYYLLLERTLRGYPRIQGLKGPIQ